MKGQIIGDHYIFCVLDLFISGPVKGLGQCFTPTPLRDLTSFRGLRRSDLQRLIRLCQRSDKLHQAILLSMIQVLL